MSQNRIRTAHTGSPLAIGKTITVIDATATVAAVHESLFSIDADSVLISLFVTAVSGDLDVVVYTLTEEGKEVDVISFPTISSPTTNLLLKKAAIVMSRIRVVATYTAACTFEVRARGISAGETSVRILGANEFEVSKASPTTVASVVIPAVLSDRNGVLLYNYSAASIVFVGETALKATDAGGGYPIVPGGTLSLDIISGASVYASTDAGTGDLRIIQAGG
jgi:hypothetical protein